ncbi:MAG: hypothetical protein WDA60_17705, partial [Acidimicrobiia bacterium]
MAISVPAKRRWWSRHGSAANATVIGRESTQLDAAIAARAAVAACLWAVSRVTGMPFGDAPWVAEPVAFPDVLATVLELLAVAGGYVLLTSRLGSRTISRTIAVVGGALLAAALVGLTTASVAPALAGEHGHGAGGHTHAAVGSGHIHTGGSADPAAVAA